MVQYLKTELRGFRLEIPSKQACGFPERSAHGSGRTWCTVGKYPFVRFIINLCEELMPRAPPTSSARAVLTITYDEGGERTVRECHSHGEESSQ